MKSRNFLLMFLLLSLATASWAEGPIGKYYLTAGNLQSGYNGPPMNFVVQGNKVVDIATQNCAPDCGQFQGEFAIALSNSVRTLGSGYYGTTLGSEYTPNLTPTGVKYPYPAIQGAYFFDGTSDGIHNYSVDYAHGTVYAFDLNWANPQLLFTITDGGEGGEMGITYDHSNNSLWVARNFGSTVWDFTLSGGLLSTFSSPTVFGSESLAIDVDHTLWMGNDATPGVFYHYNRNGSYLGDVFYPDLSNQITYGGEILQSSVPEPSSLLLLGTGFLAPLLRFRKLAGLIR